MGLMACLLDVCSGGTIWWMPMEL